MTPYGQPLTWAVLSSQCWARVGVAVDADGGGFAVGERESSGQGQQQ
ncbi:hypothetical protein [Fodinicola feengrottensis]